MKATHWPDTPIWVSRVANTLYLRFDTRRICSKVDVSSLRTRAISVLAHDCDGAGTGRFYLEKETFAAGEPTTYEGYISLAKRYQDAAALQDGEKG